MCVWRNLQLAAVQLPCWPFQAQQLTGCWLLGVWHCPHVPVDADSCHGCRLDIPLSRKRAGNVAVVKLVDQEDLMEEWMDTHEEPNIDATFIAFKGRQLFLPPGVQLAC